MSDSSQLLDQYQNTEAIIFALDGSQFVMKVLAAFDWKGIPYRIQPVSPQRLEQDLPPPHQVPVLKFGDSVVCDSTKILQFMDERIVGPKFFPPGNDDVVQMDNHLGGVFNAYVLYFNWIDDEGFNRSIRPKLEQKVPRILRMVLPCVVGPEAIRGPIAARLRERVREALGDERVASRDSMKAGLIEELKKLESRVADGRKWICATDDPTAADFTLYGVLQHLVSHSGDANLSPTLPTLWTDAETPKLAEWFHAFEQAYPISFFARRLPRAQRVQLERTW